MKKQIIAGVMALIITGVTPAFADDLANEKKIAGKDDKASETELVRQQAQDIIVTADGSQVILPESYAGKQVARGGRAGLLGNIDMMDAPFASTSYTAALMEDQQAVSVSDILQNDPGVRVSKGFGNFQELYMIRGFPVYSDDMTYNGLYGILPRQFVAAELLERLEVFRGANSFLNGAAPGGSGVGGSFNLVPKRADDKPLTKLTTGFSGNGQAYTAIDLGRRFGKWNSTGIRANIVKRYGETGIDDQDQDLSVFSLGIDYMGDQIRLSADMGYQSQGIDSPRPQVTPLGIIPEAPNAGSNYAQPWTYTDERQLFGVVRGEYDLTEKTMIWAAAGMRQGEEDNVLANPTAAANGNFTAYRFDNTREDLVLSGDAGIRTEFDTGPVGHRVTMSASAYSLESRNAYAMSNFNGISGNLYSPVPVAMIAADAFVGGVLSSPGITQEIQTSSLAMADMLSFFNDRVLLTIGARYQNIKTKSFDYNTGGLLSEYDEGKITPLAGLVFKATDQISLYTNYAQSLVPGDVAPATSNNAGEIFEPYTAEQIEAGIKYDNGRFGGSLSAFTLSLPSGYEENNVFSVNGEQCHNGLELNLFGTPWDSVRILGGMTLLDAEMVDTKGGLLDGKNPIGVPDLQMNLNVEWDLPFAKGVTISGRTVYTASQYADENNTMSIPSWTRFDLGARYNTKIFDKDVTFRAGIENLFDKDYWTSVGGYPGKNYLIASDPRTLTMSCSINF